MHEGDNDALANIKSKFSLSVVHFFLVLVQVNNKRDKTICGNSFPYCQVPFDEMKHFYDE